MTSLKNKAALGGRVVEMDETTFNQRRKIINVIYSIKNKGFNIPRVEIRIVSEETHATAYAYKGKNIVHFNRKYIDNELFTQVVLHEVIHAVFSIGEVEGCKLMHCSQFWKNRPTESEAWEIFEAYYNRWKN